MAIVPAYFYYNEQYHINRVEVLKRLSALFFANEYFSKNINFDIILKVEMSCFNKVLSYCDKHNIFKHWSNNDFTMTYSRETYRIISYIEKNNIIERLCDVDGDNDNIISNIDPLLIAEYNTRDICPEIYNQIEEQIELRKQQKVIAKYSKMYKCPRCHERKVEVKPVQNRSLDEAANMSALCTNCGHNWIAG